MGVLNLIEGRDIHKGRDLDVSQVSEELAGVGGRQRAQLEIPRVDDQIPAQVGIKADHAAFANRKMAISRARVSPSATPSIRWGAK